MFSNNFRKSHFYEIMWKNVVGTQATDDNIIGRIRLACWISKATLKCMHAHRHAHWNAHPRSDTHRNV